MAPTLYGLAASPPVRSVLLCAKAIGLDLNFKEVDLLKLEHYKPEFLELNPQHTVPLLDDGFLLPDSHAIMVYLVSKYGKDKSFYPEDLKQRAIIDHRLHFDSSVLFIRGLVISRGLLFEGDKVIDTKLFAMLEEAFELTEKFLKKNLYVAGNTLTIADFSFVTSITSWHVFIPAHEARFPNISAWINRMKKLPYYNEANQIGLEQYYALMKGKVPK